MINEYMSIKKIIISEDNIHLLNDNIITLPKPLLKRLKNHRTSLGDHPAFPLEDEKPFDYKIINKRFNELYNQMELPNHVNEDELKNELNRLITECQKIEEPIKEQLEVLCYNKVNSLFNIPEDTITFSCNIVPSVDVSDKRLKPEETDEIEFEGIEEIQELNDDVYKRRLVNCLVQGAAMYYSSKIEEYVSDLFKISPKLPELYSKILLYNNFLLFYSKDSLSIKNPTLAGNVDVHLGNDVTKTEIVADAIIFPILLNEAIKGFMELFASHGLPLDKNKALFIIKKADFLLAEPWDMRFGVELWKMVIDLLPDKNTTIIPLFFTELVSMKPKEFHETMKEIFSKTKRGRQFVENLYNDTQMKLKQDDFEDFLTNKNLEQVPITDEYFTVEELLDMDDF